MFKWLTNVFQRNLENPSIPSSSPGAFSYLGGARSTAGVAIDRQSVLGYPAVWRAVNLISHKVGRLPIHVYTHTKAGGREIDHEHQAEWLLNHRPSNLYTPHIFKSTLQAHVLLHGNGYAWILKDEMGVAQELLILNPEYMGIVFDKGRLVYIYRMGNDIKKILPENILHIKGLSHDGLIGYSVIDVLREAFGLGLAAQRYGSVYFKNNAQPGPVIISFPGKVDKEQIAWLREGWNTVHSGLDNSHKPAILANGGSISHWQIDNDMAQFLQTREFEVAQIANCFSLPPHKLGVKIATAYNSLESEEKSFLSDSLDAWLVAWESECAAKLLTENQFTRYNRFIEFDRRSLEQADYKTKSETLVAETNNGLRSQNEARELLNLPSAGADGDRLRMPSNITFIDLVGVDDDQATDEPDAPAEATVQETDQEQEPVNLNPVEGTVLVGNGRGKALLVANLERYVRRLHKATSAASKRSDYATWLEEGLSEHRSVIADGVSIITDDMQPVDSFLKDLTKELKAVDRQQVNSVFARIDCNKWGEQIWNSGI